MDMGISSQWGFSSMEIRTNWRQNLADFVVFMIVRIHWKMWELPKLEKKAAPYVFFLLRQNCKIIFRTYPVHFGGWNVVSLKIFVSPGTVFILVLFEFFWVSEKKLSCFRNITQLGHVVSPIAHLSPITVVIKTSLFALLQVRPRSSI